MWDTKIIMGGRGAKIQVFRKEFHTYIRLDYVRIEFLSCIKKMLLHKF